MSPFEDRNIRNAVVKVRLTRPLVVTKVIPNGEYVALELLSGDLNNPSFKARTADGGEVTLNNSVYSDMQIIAKSGERLDLNKIR